MTVIQCVWTELYFHSSRCSLHNAESIRNYLGFWLFHHISKKWVHRKQVSRKQPVPVSVWALNDSHINCLGIVWYLPMLVIDCRWQTLHVNWPIHWWWSISYTQFTSLLTHTYSTMFWFVVQIVMMWSGGKLNWSKVIIINSLQTLNSL